MDWQQRMIRRAGKNSNSNPKFSLMYSSCKLTNLLRRIIATWHWWCTMNKPVNCTIWWNNDHESTQTLPMREIDDGLRDATLHSECLDWQQRSRHACWCAIPASWRMSWHGVRTTSMHDQALVSDTTTPRGRLQPAISGARWRNPRIVEIDETLITALAKPCQNPAKWNNGHLCERQIDMCRRSLVYFADILNPNVWISST